MIDNLEADKLQKELLWMDDGLCREIGDAQFFSDSLLTSASDRSQAKKACRGCVVLEDCLEYALTARVLRGNGKLGGYVEGIWGGTTPRMRDEIRAERGIAAIEEEDEYDDEADHHAGSPSEWEDDCS